MCNRLQWTDDDTECGKYRLISRNSSERGVLWYAYMVDGDGNTGGQVYCGNSKFDAMRACTLHCKRMHIEDKLGHSVSW